MSQKCQCMQTPHHAEDIVSLRKLNTQNDESEGGVGKGEYEQWRQLQREGRRKIVARITVDKARKTQRW